MTKKKATEAEAQAAAEAETEGPTHPPAPLIPPTRAEVLYMQLADAIYSAIDSDTAQTIRNRVLAKATEEDRTELAALISDRRRQYQ